jgi:hypothetical protein
MAQWAAITGAALQRGATSVHATEVAQTTQEKANAEAKAVKQQEPEGAMVGKASTTKVDVAMMAKADERAMPAETGKATTEALKGPCLVLIIE